MSFHTDFSVLTYCRTSAAVIMMKVGECQGKITRYSNEMLRLYSMHGEEGKDASIQELQEKIQVEESKIKALQADISYLNAWQGSRDAALGSWTKVVFGSLTQTA